MTDDPVDRSERDEPEQEAPPAMPRWVKLSAVVVVVLVLALIVIMALAGGEHGPGLHTGAAGIYPSTPVGSWHPGAT